MGLRGIRTPDFQSRLTMEETCSLQCCQWRWDLFDGSFVFTYYIIYIYISFRHVT